MTTVYHKINNNNPYVTTNYTNQDRLFLIWRDMEISKGYLSIHNPKSYIIIHLKHLNAAFCTSLIWKLIKIKLKTWQNEESKPKRISFGISQDLSSPNLREFQWGHHIAIQHSAHSVHLRRIRRPLSTRRDWPRNSLLSVRWRRAKWNRTTENSIKVPAIVTKTAEPEEKRTKFISTKLNFAEKMECRTI